MPDGALRPLLTAPDIQARVAAMAADIRRDVPGAIHLVAVLTGAFVFLADLVRHLPGPVSLDFLATSSYGRGTTSSGQVRLLKDLDLPIEGLDVLLVEDIADSGLTLAYLQELLLARAPRSLRTAVLLNKPSRRARGVRVEYVGFDIEDRFVVGYGLDRGGRYRNLPYVAVLESQ